MPKYKLGLLEYCSDSQIHCELSNKSIFSNGPGVIEILDASSRHIVTIGESN